MRTTPRAPFVVLWALALVPVAGCGGSVAVEKPDTSGDTGSAGTSGSAPAGVCCNFVYECDLGDEKLEGSDGCPDGAECYSRAGCCNAVTRCAHRPTVDAGPPVAVDAGPAEVDAGAACSLLGSWHAHSPPWNNESTDAVINFAGDGTLGGMPAFVGKWDLQDSQLTIHDTVGADMTCSLADQWTLTFSPVCQTAPLLPIGSGCTGARRYLDWNVTLTRN